MAAGSDGLGPQVVQVVAPAVVIVVVIVGAAKLVVDPLLLHVIRFLLSGVEPQQGCLGKRGTPGSERLRCVTAGQSLSPT